MTRPQNPLARPATKDDADEIVRLAALMYESMQMDATGEPWRELALSAFATRLGVDAFAYVVENPDAPGRLVASGAATLSQRLPSPRNTVALVGYIQWVATDPPYRRRGYARDVLLGLLDWLKLRGAVSVELHATDVAAPLYRSLGFSVSAQGLRLFL